MCDLDFAKVALFARTIMNTLANITFYSVIFHLCSPPVAFIMPANGKAIQFFKTLAIYKVIYYNNSYSDSAKWCTVGHTVGGAAR